MNSHADNILIAYVQKTINSGIQRITIPSNLVQYASAEAVETVRQLCKLVNVEISIKQVY